MAEDIESIKKKYKLWWQYLECSENYENFCHLMTQVFNNKITTNFDDIKTKYRVKGKYRHLRLPKLDHDHLFGLYKNWLTFGNVLESDFEDWWKKRNGIVNLRDPDVVKKLPLITVPLNQLDQQRIRSRYALRVMQSLCSDPAYIFVAIPVASSMSDINATIKSIRDEWRHEYRVTEKDKGSQLEFGERIRHSEIQKYLDVYNLKKSDPHIKQKELREIFQREGHHFLISGKKATAKQKHDRARQIRRFVRKAERIISNVEHGLFPGKYN